MAFSTQPLHAAIAAMTAAGSLEGNALVTAPAMRDAYVRSQVAYGQQIRVSVDANRRTFLRFNGLPWYTDEDCPPDTAVALSDLPRP